MKSPPELWAEVSEAESLARHLGAVGEIRITRLEPETTVAWEGDTASGTVELAPAGWGTSVTLTAEATAVAPAGAVAPEPEPVPEPAPAAMEDPALERRRSWLTRLLGGRRTTAEVDRAAAPVGGDAEIAPEPAPAHDPLEQALAGALDSLGQAHHRPFSRG